jgi:hypothetical protein
MYWSVQVAGVWYIQLITMGMAVLLTILERVQHAFAKQRRHAASSHNGQGCQHQAAGAAAVAAHDSDGAECIAEVALPGPGKAAGEVS